MEQAKPLSAFAVFEKVPAGQSVQAVTPPADHDPSEQGTGAEAGSGHSNPGAQGKQLAMEVATAAREYVPGLQELQVKSEAAPTAAEYFPAPHGVQGAIPEEDHVPALHWTRTRT